MRIFLYHILNYLSIMMRSGSAGCDSTLNILEWAYWVRVLSFEMAATLAVLLFLWPSLVSQHISSVYFI